MFIQFEVPTMHKKSMNQVPNRRSVGRVPVDILESENGTTVYAELPGIKKQDLKLSFEDEVLTMSGTRSERKIPEDARILLHEQQVTEFQRSIWIGHPVDQEKIAAKLEDGLLTVDVPKAEIARPKTIDIR